MKTLTKTCVKNWDLASGILVSLGLAVLSGCCTAPTQQPGVDNTRETKFDARLIQDCEKLPVLKSAREADVQEWSAQVLKIHSACATLKAKENAEIKKALNIKE